MGFILPDTATITSDMKQKELLKDSERLTRLAGNVFVAQNQLARELGAEEDIFTRFDTVNTSATSVIEVPSDGNIYAYVSLIEVANNGVGHNIEGHTGGAGKHGGYAHGNLARLVPADMEYLVGYETCHQADEQLQQEGFGSGGDISGGEIGNGHTHSAGHAAPETADEQGSQDTEHIAQVEGGFLGANRDINAEIGETDVAQRREQGRHGKGQSLFAFHKSTSSFRSGLL